jgi:hypothetical protein
VQHVKILVGQAFLAIVVSCLIGTKLPFGNSRS